MCLTLDFPVVSTSVDAVIMRSGIVWYIFLRILFFSMTFTFVTPFLWNWGSSSTPEGPVRQYGECSWYNAPGPLHGVGGEATALTAAHKTLPLGSFAFIVNDDNKKRVRVRITARGPLVYGRIAALSPQAFREIADLDQKVFPCFVSPAT